MNNNTIWIDQEGGVWECDGRTGELISRKIDPAFYSLNPGGGTFEWSEVAPNFIDPKELL